MSVSASELGNDPCNFQGLYICDSSGHCDDEKFDCYTEDCVNGQTGITGQCDGDDDIVCWEDQEWTGKCDTENHVNSSVQSNSSVQWTHNKTSNSSSLQKAVYENVKIRLERDLCYGWCPHYYIEIEGDGEVLYRGYDFVNVTGERTTHIDPAVVTDLVSEFYSKGFFNLSSQYSYGEGLPCITDQANVRVSISVNDTSKSISDYQGCGVPSELRYLEDRIDQVTNSSQWTEPRSQQSLEQEFHGKFK